MLRTESELQKFVERMALKPLRVCRYLNHCELCDQDIVAGQEYRDGGYGRRVHELCLKRQTGGRDGK